MDGAQTVSLGCWDSAAIKTDDSLWLWGDSSYFGDHRSKPEKVMDDVQSVSLGVGYSAVIKADGSLWLCGYNGDGQLGDGSTESHYREFICIAE